MLPKVCGVFGGGVAVFGYVVVGKVKGFWIVLHFGFEQLSGGGGVAAFSGAVVGTAAAGTLGAFFGGRGRHEFVVVMTLLLENLLG